jgi:general secretion pathway protein F
MASFRYRAVAATGLPTEGFIEADERPAALERLRQQGLRPIEVAAAVSGPTGAAPKRGRRVTGPARKAATRAIADLAVLVQAGLTLDRALALMLENISDPIAEAAFRSVHQQVKEGAALSRAIAGEQELASPLAPAMIEAGEANGRLGAALESLAQTLQRAEDLRQLIVSSLIYPFMLVVIAVAVILVMLLFVVPQFETLFAQAQGELPFASQMVMAASQFTRQWGLAVLGGLIAGGFLLARAAQTAGVRARLDRWTLGMPQIGQLVRFGETARFARVLGALAEGGVPLPQALSLAQRTLTNQHMATRVAHVAAGLNEGAGLAGPLARAGVFPPLALSFLRTGEETSQLGPMLSRLADLLDRDVRQRLGRLIAVLTPALTVTMGGVVGFVIAAIMSAILGFNDLALAG